MHAGDSNLAHAIADCYYVEAMNATGWNILQISSNGSYSDVGQSYSAGYCEGYLTQKQIWHAYQNFLADILKGKQLLDEAMVFVIDQNNYIKAMIGKRPADAYWQLVNTLWQQLMGMYDGYSARVSELGLAEQKLTFNQFYYLTNMGDLGEIMEAFYPPESSVAKTPDCNIFIKLTDEDLYSTHSTFNRYSLMLRIYKIYNFAWSNPLVLSNRVQFSSRPGDL